MAALVFAVLSKTTSGDEVDGDCTSKYFLQEVVILNAPTAITIKADFINLLFIFFNVEVKIPC
ncbi:hypothetical protein D3C85_990850 [compost metagenome]